MTKVFSTVSKLRVGYDTDEVDEFFDHAREVYEGAVTEPLTSRDIQTCAFDLTHGGYSTAEVDAALARLESAFVARQRHEFTVTRGPDAWMADLAERAQSLYGRLGRPDGERFARADRGEPAYDTDDVDDLCERLVAYFDRTSALAAQDVRSAVFRRRKGRGGYAEAPVDAFFARTVEVLLGVE
ncbi:DivIVA domain-containing protein [Sanguibacter gelidistatuariae]|uniref:DivIVA domain-containing protein n=1 Tax=Sanguibacter gelidistatuariae TaxID=1814289 RepID=A0A1G6NKS7_9MICO|nr:DivIVA domain-containing protein [Sanguibacter gelidistatuariae]SDC68602.1 DivIVA domain-containing protein [Sanguibacter gelidistatuariae]